MPHLATNVFWIPKAGTTAAEYEDAFCVGKWSVEYPERVLVAVADGASEGLLSRQWANLLVKRFVRHWQEPSHLDDWLSGTLDAWEREKQNYLRRRELDKKPVQWYEEPGLQAGAFAAFNGFVLTRATASDPETESDSLSWNAIALGDSCLFQIRGESFICAFPINVSSDLNNRPFLLSSNSARNQGIVERFEFSSGDAQPQDQFFLVTDALAAWFLREYENWGAPWHVLSALTTDPSSSAFAEWIENQRAAHTLRNDDVTLIKIDVLS